MSGHPHHPEGFCTVANCDYSKALLAGMRGKGGHTDESVVDAIASLLGTSAEWSGDTFEDIANLIGRVRPHPGDSADTYRQKFQEATGRPVPAAWDFTEEDEDWEEEE